MENETSMLLAGKITGAYGIKGWVKIFALTEQIENILAFPALFLKERSGMKLVEIVEGKRHGKGLIARLGGVDNRDAAEALRGRELWMSSADLPQLEEGDFYWHELTGMQVWSDGGVAGAAESPYDSKDLLLLGVVDHMLETGANDVMVLAPCEGSIDDRERLLPYLVGSVVMRVDRERGRIDVAWHPDD
jgi:16S rRNA processing protein RimM